MLDGILKEFFAIESVTSRIKNKNKMLNEISVLKYKKNTLLNYEKKYFKVCLSITTFMYIFWLLISLPLVVSFNISGCNITSILDIFMEIIFTIVYAMVCLVPYYGLNWLLLRLPYNTYLKAKVRNLLVECDDVGKTFELIDDNINT